MLTTKDNKFMTDAFKVASMMLNQLNVPPNEIDTTYSETFKYTYSDGDVCYLELINKISLPEEYSEDAVDSLIRALIKVNPDNNSFAEMESIEEIPLETVLSYMEEDYAEDFSEYDFAEDLSEAQLTGFFKRLIATVYLPGVSRLEDNPSADNNYLATNDDVTEFKGAFFDGDDRYEFTIAKKGAKWGISYKPDAATSTKLESEQKDQ